MTMLLQTVIRKRFKSFELGVELRLEANQGQVLVLFGPSGSGKTITIKCIAGITDPDVGFISIGDRVVFDSSKGINVKIAERRVGYLPQNYALFPHLTVLQNISFGLFKWDKLTASRRVYELLDLMQLKGLEKRYPRELSGGQQQRVALARALAPQPSILLLDEPFAALDSNIRVELRQNLALLSRELDLPVVFITHDLEEAYVLADRIALYDQGSILQYDNREEIFYRPTSLKAASLVGIRNLWEGRVLKVEAISRLVLVRTAFADLWSNLPENQDLPSPGTPTTVCIRPENIKLKPVSQKSFVSETKSKNSFTAFVTNEIARGSRYTIQLSLEEAAKNTDLETEIPSQEYAMLKNNRSQNNLNCYLVNIDPPSVHLIYSK